VYQVKAPDGHSCSVQKVACAGHAEDALDFLTTLYPEIKWIVVLVSGIPINQPAVLEDTERSV